MGLEGLRVLVTGGAGFIGSHLVDRLMAGGCRVTVLDNLSGGSLENLGRWRGNGRLRFVRADLKDPAGVGGAVGGVDIVFHFAANPEVRVGETDPGVHFRENLVATLNLLEAMRGSPSASALVFASTSTVYGEAEVMPTPEDYGGSLPISTYGASKLGCEALASSYAHTFGMRALILRLANIVGSRSGHGVIHDFIRKLEEDPRRLEILGDGSQRKSYLHVSDCVEAVLRATGLLLEGEESVEVYNVGSPDQVSVTRIAEVVVEEMGLRGVEFAFTGGVDGGRGWRGDVKTMLLSVERLLKTGWRPKLNSEQAVRAAAREILRERKGKKEPSSQHRPV